MNHTTLLNYLIEKYGLKSYLEIGVRATEQNFDKIKCDVKYGVDPDVTHPRIMKMTSDDFFMYIIGIQSVKTLKIVSSYDIVFIDGDHTASQVERDFNNSLRCLNEGGFIVIHDCLPTDEKTTCVPRGSQKIWHGDVWKFIFRLNECPDIDFVTFNFDEGCCVVWKTKDETMPIFISDSLVTWDSYLRNRNLIMRIIEESDLDNYLSKFKEAAR